jgi:formyl-CoA transferase
MVGLPVKFGGTPAEIRAMAPALGEHTDEVLLECGLTQDETDQMEKDGVIRRARPEAG